MAKFFTEQEIRGLLVFVPLTAIGVGVLMLAQPKSDPEDARRVEQEMQTAEQTAKPADEQRDAAVRELKLRPFDPNTVTYEEMLEMGFRQKEALSLLRYRAGGKVFRIPEEVDECRGIEHPVYLQLKPYIRIGEAFALKPKFKPERTPKELPARKLQQPRPFRIDTVSARYLQAVTRLSEKQAEAFIHWRDKAHVHDMAGVRDSFVIDDSLAAALEPYIIFPEAEPRPVDERIDLNRADSVELLRVNGIGEKTAGRIVRYRERLGGFARAEQLSDIKGISKSNYEKIIEQIYCDSCEIRKIDINFVDPKTLEDHPYIGEQQLRKFAHERSLKGGWSTVEELIEQKIFTREEAARLAPYLVFGHRDGTD